MFIFIGLHVHRHGHRDHRDRRDHHLCAHHDRHDHRGLHVHRHDHRDRRDRRDHQICFLSLNFNFSIEARSIKDIFFAFLQVNPMVFP